MNITEFRGEAQRLFRRPMEVTALDGVTFIQVRARCARDNKDMVASAGVDCYKQVEPTP